MYFDVASRKSSSNRWRRLGQLGLLAGIGIGTAAVMQPKDLSASPLPQWEARFDSHHMVHAQGQDFFSHYAQIEHHDRDARHHRGTHKPRDFVRRAGAELKLGHEEFRFAGSNNYYLPYQSHYMVDDVLNTAAAEGFNVMRVFGNIEIGNLDGTNTISPAPNGVYFQFWDGGKPAYNDGPTGLEHLDYVVAKAKELGIRLVLPLSNNWGGMDQYVAWAGGGFHDEFYTNPAIRDWYKQWIKHLLNRKNTITGVRYKDEPAIMMWELGNEPRCGGSGNYPRSSVCTTDTIVDWADEVSHFIKKNDPNHLVAVGDEGFYCDPAGSNWIDNCNEGVDTLALTALPKIDVMSFHLYPNGWGQTLEWANNYIVNHFLDAEALDKPAMLGEFGWLDVDTRNTVYRQWTDLAMASGGSGALYWILSGQRDDGSLYPDYDGFTVYCPGPVCTTLSNFGAMMDQNRVLEFAPVADDDIATTKFNAPVVVQATRNDIAYGTSISTATLDLDPATAGIQSALSMTQGTLTAASDGAITFAPAKGYHGTVRVGYTVADGKGRLSNEAYLLIAVENDPDAPQVLHSFELGTEGFGGPGTVERSSEFATDGSYSLKITNSTGGWFNTAYSKPLNLTKKTILEWDVFTAAGTSQELAIQLGTSWDWCTGGGWLWVNGGSSSTVGIDLTTLECSSGLPPNLADVRALNLFVSAVAAPVYFDNIRVKSDQTVPNAVIIHSFESGVEGFHSTNSIAATIETSTEFATDGNSSLKISNTAGDWFGTTYATPQNFAGNKYLEWDVFTTGGTSQQLVVQLGTSWDWCEGGGWAWVNGGSTSTVSVDLDSLSCSSGGAPNLADVRALAIFMANGGTPVYVDAIRVRAVPSTNKALLLHSFEAGVEGFKANSSLGTVEQSADFATDGSYSLKATSSSGDWFGVDYSAPKDFTGKTRLSWDIYTANGTSQQLAVKLGSTWDWCEAGGWAWTNGGAATTISIELSQLSCGSGNAPDLTTVQSLNVYMANGGSPVYVDNIRVE